MTAPQEKTMRLNASKLQRAARLARAGASGRLIAGVECYAGPCGAHGQEIQAGGRTIWCEPRATLEEAQARLVALRAEDVRVRT